ncbi:MAG: lysophospholipid acyltransferase family protein [Candidatus Tantalella remota]|nr:lysophospholipid acyltransferase family protein [Candidatus Tantalella remota]
MKIKTRRYYLYYLARILFFVISIVPRQISLFLASALGKGAFRLLEKERSIAVGNLDEVMGGSHRENVRIAEGVFSNMAKNGADWIKMMSISKSGIQRMVTEVHGLDNLHEALEKGKGVIGLGSHFGNWELLLIYLSTKGYKGAVVGRRIYFHKYDKLITRLRNRFGTPVIYRDESPKKSLRVLRDGGILGILADQDVDSVEGVFVDFFGKPAFTPTAPVKLSMATGAPLLPGFMIRKPDNTYKMVWEKPISSPQGKDKEEDVLRLTQEWTAVLEKYIREYPDQWVWLHRRWKSSPPETEPVSQEAGEKA